MIDFHPSHCLPQTQYQWWKEMGRIGTEKKIIYIYIMESSQIVKTINLQIQQFQLIPSTGKKRKEKKIP